MSEPRIITLSRPVQAYGEEVTQLKLREPTTADVRAVNALPYVFSAEGGGQPTPVPEICAKYLSRLAGMPMSAIDALEFADFQALAWEVANYFLARMVAPASEPESTTRSAPPTSGE